MAARSQRLIARSREDAKFWAKQTYNIAKDQITKIECEGPAPRGGQNAKQYVVYWDDEKK